MSLNTLWNAVTTRDANADGLFVYAVKSTRIYCRPSCASRKPRRDRVEFFPSAAMAEAQGFRACRRCRPTEVLAGTPALERVRRACEALARAPEAPWPLSRIARTGGASPVQIQRAFRSVLGLSPRDYVAACRHQRFLTVLRNGRRVTDAVYEAGYGSSSRAYGSAIRLPGMTPATYGRGGLGAQIDWLVIDSPIGRILVAATARGLCFVEVGESDAALMSALREEFPAADLGSKPSPRLRALAAAAHAAACARPVPINLPVDIRGTAFQWRVWRALTRIPRGETRSYSEVARAIGVPSSVRAVARACATNPLTLVVPCHRVVRQGGGLGGYRWGIPVKNMLIKSERT